MQKKPKRAKAPRTSAPAALPSVVEWYQLIEIASSIDLLVDDDDAPIRTAGALLGSGRLDGEAANDPPARSKLAAMVGRVPAVPGVNWWSGSLPSVGGMPSIPTLADSLCDAMPGVQNLGATRQERLAALALRMPDLAAYNWLRTQPAYQQAVSSMAGAVGRSHPAYRADVAEYRLISAIGSPLCSFLSLSGQFSYPSKDEIASKLKAAEKIKAFFSENTGLYLGDAPNWEGSTAADTLVRELRKLQADWLAKPRDELTYARLEVRDSFIRALAKSFGTVSTFIVAALMGLVGQPKADAAHIRARIRALGLSNYTEKEAAPLPAVEAGDMWGQLVKKEARKGG